MKRWFTSLVVTALVLAGVLAALTTRPVAAADDQIVSADRAVTAAFEKGDKAAINKWVDPEFTWIDTQGIMWPLRESRNPQTDGVMRARADLRLARSSSL